MAKSIKVAKKVSIALHFRFCRANARTGIFRSVRIKQRLITLPRISQRYNYFMTRKRLERNSTMISTVTVSLGLSFPYLPLGNRAILPDKRLSLDHKVLIMNLLSRVMGAHKLCVLSFYTYIIKYVVHNSAL
jgi:hypothetical protein